MKICGIMLSGGMSRRFQRPGEPWVDKALYPIKGKPMIRIIYELLLSLSDTVIVSTGIQERAEIYRRVLGNAIYVEDVEGFAGPLSGLLASLSICPYEYAVAVPVDMPYIGADLLRELLARLSTHDASSPILPNGLVETTVVAMRRSIARDVLEILRRYGRARLADLHRGVPKIYLLNMRKHGFDPMMIANINRREDIDRRVEYPEGPLDSDVDISRSYSIEDIENPSNEKLRGSLWWTLRTGDPYDEVRLYLGKGVYMFAAYALEDSKNILERYVGRMLLESVFSGLT
ncbi:MAG: molybdenum cofactor guanylyltransferase [Sulfolobales archaeon]